MESRRCLVSKKFSTVMVFLAVSLLCAASVFAAAPPKKIVVGISKIVSHPALDAVVKGIQDELTAAKMNVAFDVQNANGDISTAASIANKFQSEKVTLAVGVATPTAQALVNTLKGIPIVFSAVTDPVKAGLVGSLKKGDKNVTGVSDMTPVKQQIELLLKIKKIKRLGHIYTSSEENAVVLAGIVKQVCKELNIEFVETTVTKSSEVKQAAQAIMHRVDALYISTDNTVVSAMSAVAEVAMKSKVPIMSADPSSSEAYDVLASWGFDYYKMGRATGKLIVEILNGKKPEQLPTRFMTKASDVDLLINLDVAKKLGLKVPQDIVKSAKTIRENGKIIKK
jgi:putative tryptophan/tyrosine transport system substrate-binding protein